MINLSDRSLTGEKKKLIVCKRTEMVNADRLQSIFSSKTSLKFIILTCKYRALSEGYSDIPHLNT